ncbi:replication initiator protein [Peromfec virus RodF8_58]|uniref:Replication initiator protein n=1 Tax=Peromfec virus RodF8_58 TaxID=2929385 RepID=A0A976N2M7_9VIRU|nr:replication initiator protein [Peromfec virus RodF8_58]
MRCLHPIHIDIEAYGLNYSKVPVPCGHCEACLHSRARDWQIRLYEEMKTAKTAYFLTLTYNDDNVPTVPIWDESTGEYLGRRQTVKVRDLQLFWKKLRKRFPNANLRYFAVSEYGPQTLRPHYHAIVFNLPREYADKHKLARIWGNGFTEISKVTYGRIAYVTKYCFGGLYVPDGYAPNFMRCSKRPALGVSWLFNLWQQLETEDLDTMYYFKDGYRLPVPKYYKRKVKESLQEDEKRDRLIRYVEERLFEDRNAIEEDKIRLAKFEKTGIWEETPTEQKIRKFIRDFHEKYNKNRKL